MFFRHDDIGKQSFEVLVSAANIYIPEEMALHGLLS
jgi:hypothetical protein